MVSEQGSTGPDCMPVETTDTVYRNGRSVVKCREIQHGVQRMHFPGTVLSGSGRFPRAWRLGFLAAPFFALSLLFPAGVEGGAVKYITWKNPVVYENQAQIPESVRQTIETRLYFSLDCVAWTVFATVPGGGESWSGVLPVPVGVMGYYSATSRIPPNGVEGRKASAIAYREEAPSADLSDEITVVLGNHQDTYVSPGDGFNRSSDPLLRIAAWDGAYGGSRGLLKWDLSSLPAGVRITEATLRLYYVGEDGGGGDNAFGIRAAKVIGVNPDLGKATWATPDNVVSWSGGTGNLAAAESTVAVGKNRGWVVWNITSMAEEWMAAQGTNFGMALDPDVSAAAGSNRNFAAREHPDPRLRPELVITYRQPSGTPGPPASSAPPPGTLPDVFTASVGGYEDTFVNLGSYSNINYSGDPLIRIYTWPANSVANRGFIRWDLSGLPDNITVTSATLWLYYVDEEGSGKDNAYTVSVAKVVGVRPDLRLATWNRFDGTSPWPGGANGGSLAMAPAESSATIGKIRRWVSWDVSGMVQDWVSAPEANFGMAIDADTTAAADSNRAFASREHPDPLLRPRLLVTYVRN